MNYFRHLSPYDYQLDISIYALIILIHILVVRN